MGGEGRGREEQTLSEKKGRGRHPWGSELGPSQPGAGQGGQLGRERVRESGHGDRRGHLRREGELGEGGEELLRRG
jgi:hypothetical protein